MGQEMFSCKYKLIKRTNTYAWITATATSRMVSSNKTVAVRIDTAGMIGRRAVVAVGVSRTVLQSRRHFPCDQDGLCTLFQPVQD